MHASLLYRAPIFSEMGACVLPKGHAGTTRMHLVRDPAPPHGLHRQRGGRVTYVPEAPESPARRLRVGLLV